MHEVADLLDQKAFGLEQAAQRYHEAVKKIDAPDYEKAVEDAAIYHRAADNITIDYSGIDTDALIDLGMTQPRVADDPVAGNFDPGSSGVAKAASDTSTPADADTWFAAAADTPADDAPNARTRARTHSRRAGRVRSDHGRVCRTRGGRRHRLRRRRTGRAHAR